MISKSIMVEMANTVGGNAVAVIDGTVTVAVIDGTVANIVATAVDGDITITVDGTSIVIGTSIVADDADEDDTELLGNRALAAGGRVLARMADTRVALVKGSSGWVGVRA